MLLSYVNLRFSAIARVGVANRGIHRAEPRASRGTHIRRFPERCQSTAVAVQRVVLHESHREIWPLREILRRQTAGLFGILVSY